MRNGSHNFCSLHTGKIFLNSKLRTQMLTERSYRIIIISTNYEVLNTIHHLVVVINMSLNSKLRTQMLTERSHRIIIISTSYEVLNTLHLLQFHERLIKIYCTYFWCYTDRKSEQSRENVITCLKNTFWEMNMHFAHTLAKRWSPHEI